ncbi:MAG: ribonuclease P protein component [Mycobacteriales bacterium]
MLPARSRLRRASAFTQVIRGGKRSSLGRSASPSAKLVVHWCCDRSPDSATAPPRVGLIIGRGVGNSVQRHRLARRLRHLMLTRLPKLPARTDLVIRVLPTAGSANSAQLGIELDVLLSRIRPESPQHSTTKPARVSS